MKKNLFSKDIDPACGYCTLGRRSSDGDKILCPHRGVVDATSSCGKFRYNPLNRIPRKAPRLPDYNKEEFEL